MVEPVEPLDRGPDPEVADRQHVGPLEVDQQEHVRGPAPKAAAGGDLLTNLVVRQLVQAVDLEVAGNDVLGQRADVLDFPPGEPDRPEVGRLQGEQLGGRRHPSAEALLQPSRDGTRRVTRNLLPDDRVDQHAEGIAERPCPAPCRCIDRLGRLDEACQLPIAGLQGNERLTAS